MYEPFYSLSTDAFRLTPDPKFCFAHASYSQARAYLDYALKLGEGFIMVTGRPGTGKTTLIEAFVNELEMSNIVAKMIAESNLEATELLRAVAYAYGIDAEGLDKVTLRLRIQQLFTQQVQSGRRVLLIIDEAQGLSHSALEELRLLADLQAGVRPLLQFFIVGQDSLRDLMRSPDMEQFQQRVIGACHLEPLNLRDTRGYVEHRLRQAGWTGDPEMTGEAIVSIYQHSQGVPRHINKTCTRLLLHGLLEGKHELDEADVLTIAAELREEQLGPLECNQVEFPGTVEPMLVPELEDGSLSIAELALHADSEAAKRPVAPARAATVVEREPGTHRAARRSVARRAHNTTQARQTKRPAKKPEAWWPDIVVLGRTLQQRGMEAARKFDSRLQWHGGLAVKLVALLVVTLSAAALVTHFEDDGIDRNAVLATYSELGELLPARPGDVENIGAVNLEPNQPVVVAEQQGTETLVAGAGTAVSAGEATRQFVPESSTTDIAVPDAVSAIPVSQQVTVASDIVTVVEASHDEEREQVVENNVPVLALLPASGTDAVLLQDVAALDEDAAKQEPVTETDDFIVREATELAVLVPIAEQAPTPLASSDDDVTLPRVSPEPKIDELLSLGKQALDEHRLLMPPGNSAHHYYQQVLILEPGNAEASDGIGEIVRRYTSFAERALDSEDQEKASLYINRGLRVRPEDRQLLALQERMNAWLTGLELEAAQIPVAPPPPRTAEPPPPPPESKDFMSRLKVFFSKGQRGDQEDNIWEE